MKKLVFIIPIIFVLSSCFSVYFDSIQPADGNRISEVPKEYQGIWKDDNDGSGMEIGKNFFSITSVVTTEETNERTSHVQTNYLSDSLILIDAGKHLVLNVKSDLDAYWAVYIATKLPSGDIHIYSPTVSEKHIKNTGLKNITPSGLADMETEDIYLSGAISKKDLNKLIDKENRLFILKKDGSIEE